jgi:hypothetical protein
MMKILYQFLNSLKNLLLGLRKLHTDNLRSRLKFTFTFEKSIQISKNNRTLFCFQKTINRTVKYGD